MCKFSSNDNRLRFQGAVQGPEEFAEGFVIGVRSLLGHTVGVYPIATDLIK